MKCQGLQQLLLAGSASALLSAADFNTSCTALADKLTSQPNTTVLSTAVVLAGTNLTFPNIDATCGAPWQVVSSDICRVRLNVTTSASSGFVMEGWLPSNWTGRFLSTGNGGLGGCIQYSDMDYTSSLGFAAVGTNNGHNGKSGVVFYQRPEVQADFAYRAMHLGVVTGKKVTETFYGANYTKSYYLGCSTGGREGMKEVQDYPEDFDGVVAGAPAIDFNNLNTWSAHFLPVTGTNTSDTFVTRAQWALVHADIVAQCDTLDGYADGIIEATDRCLYKADGLLCGGGNSTVANASACLTAAQVKTVNTIFSPMLAPNGTLLYPRMQPGSEAASTDAYDSCYNGEPSDKSDWIKYVVFADPDLDLLTAITPAMYAKSDELNPFNIRTFEGDISAFKARGNKLLHYHGTMDPIISSENSPRYYEHVSSTMGLAPSELDEFYRLFRVSGMGHCRGGPGAHFIGNVANNLAGLDPDQNVLMAMVRWVEEGIAPETITGTAFVNGTQGGEVDYTRRHCRWPLRNQFNGGDGKDPDSWSCVA